MNFSKKRPELKIKSFTSKTMVLGDRTTRKITVRGQEYRWAVIGRSESSGQPNACQCKQCRVLSLIVEKRLLPPSHASRAYQKSSSAHPSRRRSIQLTVKLGHQLPWIGWCPSREDLERHMLPRQFQLLYGFVRIRFDLQSIPTLRQLAIDAIFNAYTTMEALPLRPSELPGRQAVPVTRKSLRSSVFPVDRATGLPDIRGFKWDKKRQPKDPRLFSLPDSPLFSSFIGDRFSLQTLSVVHSKWCYAKQIRPSQVANLIEKTLDHGYWQTDSANITLAHDYDRKQPHPMAWATEDKSLRIPYREIDFTSTNHIDDPDQLCSCLVPPQEAELYHAEHPLKGSFG